MSLPLAYFLTWACYGQRLHGDERGTVDREHNRRGSPMLAPDPRRVARERAVMNGPPVTLSAAMRAVVEDAIPQLCEERGWRLITQSVRTTHVHVVVNCRGSHSPERAMAQFNARLTRELRRADLAGEDQHLWAEHGSTRWINDYAGLYGAIAYVNDWQTGPNREMLEEHRRATRAHIESLKAWLREQGLPEDGSTVVVGESMEERHARVNPEVVRNEPRTE
ncbi:MAG TPA: transposase [Phycisphaerales bacterium]|nr:transposase [Phycisphaerales bacterium]